MVATHNKQTALKLLVDLLLKWEKVRGGGEGGGEGGREKVGSGRVGVREGGRVEVEVEKGQWEEKGEIGRKWEWGRKQKEWGRSGRVRKRDVQRTISIILSLRGNPVDSP